MNAYASINQLVIEGNHWWHRGNVTKAADGFWYNVLTHREFFGEPEHDCSVTYRITVDGMERVPNEPDALVAIGVSRRKALELKLAQRKCTICQPAPPK